MEGRRRRGIRPFRRRRPARRPPCGRLVLAACVVVSCATGYGGSDGDGGTDGGEATPEVVEPDVVEATDGPADGSGDAADEATPEVVEPDATEATDGPTDGPADAADEATPPAGACAVLGGWVASAPFTDAAHVSHPLPSFAVGSWYYVHTMDPGGGDRILYSARAAADGTLGPWQVASTDHGGGPHGFTAVVAAGEAYHFRNGHIARYRLTPDGRMEGDVELLETDVTASFLGERYVWDTAVWAAGDGGASFLLHLGGFSFVPYAYRQWVLRNSVPPGPAFVGTGQSHPAERPGKSAFFGPPGRAGGYVYSGQSNGDRLWRLELRGDGSVGGWTELAALPAGSGNGRGDLFVARRTLFAVRGARVFRAVLDDAGGLGPWEEQPALPEEQIDVHWGDGHLEGAAYGVIGGFVYVTGPKRVYGAPVVPAPCGP